MNLRRISEDIFRVNNFKKDDYQQMKLIPRAFAKFHHEIAKFTRPEENYDSDDVMMTSCDHNDEDNDKPMFDSESNIQWPPIEISVIKNRFSICSRMHQKQGWLTLELYKDNLPFGQVYQVNKRKWFKNPTHVKCLMSKYAKMYNSR